MQHYPSFDDDKSFAPKLDISYNPLSRESSIPSEPTESSQEIYTSEPPALIQQGIIYQAVPNPGFIPSYSEAQPVQVVPVLINNTPQASVIETRIRSDFWFYSCLIYTGLVLAAFNVLSGFQHIGLSFFVSLLCVGCYIYAIKAKSSLNTKRQKRTFIMFCVFAAIKLVVSIIMIKAVMGGDNYPTQRRDFDRPTHQYGPPPSHSGNNSMKEDPNGGFMMDKGKNGEHSMNEDGNRGGEMTSRGRNEQNKMGENAPKGNKMNEDGRGGNWERENWQGEKRRGWNSMEDYGRGGNRMSGWSAIKVGMVVLVVLDLVVNALLIYNAKRLTKLMKERDLVSNNFSVVGSV